jgi:tetratricopeptide (TPR) repeat protein
MNRSSIRILVFVLLAAASFSIATVLQPFAARWNRRAGADSTLKILLGDSRRLFANHFFVKADIAFHSGYYPSVFDQAQTPKDSRHMTEDEGDHHGETEKEHEKEHEREMSFLGPPRDWIERFGRNFFVTHHSHLFGGTEREILPWLRISAELDPQRVDTYTVAAFWLRTKLGKSKEAGQFLREGLMANPNSYEILFALGRLYYEDYHDAIRARNVWELALRRWEQRETGKKDPDHLAYDQITVHLAHLEEDQGNFEAAIGYLELAKKASPTPEALQKQIDELKKKTGK